LVAAAAGTAVMAAQPPTWRNESPVSVSRPASVRYMEEVPSVERTDCGKRAVTLTTRNSLPVLKKAEEPTLMRATYTPPLRASREMEVPAALLS
jgi:hypothetical protein